MLARLGSVRGLTGQHLGRGREVVDPDREPLRAVGGQVEVEAVEGGVDQGDDPPYQPRRRTTAHQVPATALLPKTEGFTSLGWTVLVVAGYASSIWLLTVVVRELPVSVTYAIWAGAGTALVAVVGLVFLGESFTWLKAASLALIVAGVVGLNLTGAH